MKKILIVEDMELNRDLIVQLLEDQNEILTAADGAEGLQLAARERLELNLMDLSLPVIVGWEATRRIKANAALDDIPIIALSAHAMMGDREKALQSGCDEYLGKPLDETLPYETDQLARIEGPYSDHAQAEADPHEFSEQWVKFTREGSVTVSDKHQNGMVTLDIVMPE